MTIQETKPRSKKDTAGQIADKNRELFLQDVESRALKNAMYALSLGEEGLAVAVDWVRWAAETVTRMGGTITSRTPSKPAASV